MRKVKEFHIKHGFLTDELLKNHCHGSSDAALKYLSEKLEIQAKSLNMIAQGSSIAGDERVYRAWLMVEELQEAIWALAINDEILLADALGDLEYVVKGTAVTYSIPLDEIFDEIHKSNMTKIKRDMETNPRMRDKGPDYVAPDIKGILERVENQNVLRV